jgi:hypothetical protein
MREPSCHSSAETSTVSPVIEIAMLVSNCGYLSNAAPTVSRRPDHASGE